MKIVVAGGGKVGESLCMDLAAENHDIVVIDTDAEVVEHLIDSIDITGIVGNGANLALQRKAGVPDCDVFIAVTASDEINIIASIIAHKLGVKAILARVRNPEYASDFEFVQDNLGVSLIINPELEAAKSIARSIRFPSATEIETFVGGQVQIVGVWVAKGSSFVGMQLNRFRETYGTVLVCVVQRGHDVFIPDGSFVLQAGDLLHVTGAIGDLAAFYKAAGCFTKKIRSVMIIGGSRITRYLLQILSPARMDICVIDNNKATTNALSGDFPKVKVIAGDGTDHALLEELSVGGYDCFVSLTGVDEENLMTSLYAVKQKVPKVITKINRTRLLSLINDIGLDTIVTPKRLVSDNIIRFVRAMNNSLESKVEAMYRIADDKAEALQFEVLKDSRATGKPLKDLKLKKNILITYIVRGKQLIFPTGNDEIHPGDHIIAVTTERNFDEIDDLLVDEARL